MGISIHAPRAGRDIRLGFRVLFQSTFQSTRPVRGATLHVNQLFDDIHISIHAPRAGRDFLQSTQPVDDQDFNPRAPCGARQNSNPVMTSNTLFQSTRPVRGATQLR